MVRRVNRKRVLCTTTFFYESLMKSGQKEYSRKIVAAHIKVAYLWQFNCKYKYRYISYTIAGDSNRNITSLGTHQFQWILLVRSKFVYAANGIGMKLVTDGGELF